MLALKMKTLEKNSIGVTQVHRNLGVRWLRVHIVNVTSKTRRTTITRTTTSPRPLQPLVVLRQLAPHQVVVRSQSGDGYRYLVPSSQKRMRNERTRSYCRWVAYVIACARNFWVKWGVGRWSMRYFGKWCIFVLLHFGLWPHIFGEFARTVHIFWCFDDHSLHRKHRGRFKVQQYNTTRRVF